MKKMFVLILALGVVACSDKALTAATKADIDEVRKKQSLMSCPVGEVSISIEAPAMTSGSSRFSYAKITDAESTIASGSKVLEFFKAVLLPGNTSDTDSISARYKAAQTVEELELMVSRHFDIRRYAKIACGPQATHVQSEVVEDHSSDKTVQKTYFFTCFQPCN